MSRDEDFNFFGVEPRRSRFKCVGRDNTCANDKLPGKNYCAECGAGLYQSPEEKAAANRRVEGQVARGQGRLGRYTRK